jgi:hypothetical protein
LKDVDVSVGSSRNNVLYLLTLPPPRTHGGHRPVFSPASQSPSAPPSPAGLLGRICQAVPLGEDVGQARLQVSSATPHAVPPPAAVPPLRASPAARPHCPAGPTWM